jgi:oligopeptidase B
VIPGSDRVYLRGVTAFRDHLAITERVDGLDQLRLRSYDGKESASPSRRRATPPRFGSNPEFAPAAYRLSYSSMVTPATVYDYHPKTDRLETLKVQEIPSGYDPSQYVTERLMLPARDGKKVPVSVVYKKGFEKNGRASSSSTPTAPTAMPSRRASRPAGSACSTAASPMPSPTSAAATTSATTGSWTASSTKRTNTFNDFVDAAKGLIAAGFTSPATSPSRAARPAAS